MKNAVVIIDRDVRINHQIVLGLTHELQTQSEWDIHILDHRADFQALKRSLRDIRPDAVAVRGPVPRLARLLEAISVPWAIVAREGRSSQQTAMVVPDDDAIGTMAAEYLLAHKFEHFASVSVSKRENVRVKTFNYTVRRRCKSLSEYQLRFDSQTDHPFNTYKDPRGLEQWLHELPKPCAVFAHSDQPGAHLIRTCTRNGIRVPEEVSVLGVDDDPLFCHTVSPNLASIHIPNARIGIEAARMLMDWKPGRRMLAIPPTTVVERASCRPPRRSDPQVDMAIAHLRKEVAQGVRVRDLQKLTGLTPHQLVYRFSKVTGRTPMDMILRHRITVAKQMLAENTTPIKEVAHQSGFNNATQFYVAFRNQTGLSPSDYRAQFAP